MRSLTPIVVRLHIGSVDACPLTLRGGQVAERQNDMPPAAPALDMQLPRRHVADRRGWHRVGVEGQLGHRSRAVSHGHGPDERQAGAAQFVDQSIACGFSRAELGGRLRRCRENFPKSMTTVYR
jgi:hypothetical protein